MPARTLAVASGALLVALLLSLTLGRASNEAPPPAALDRIAAKNCNAAVAAAAAQRAESAEAAKAADVALARNEAAAPADGALARFGDEAGAEAGNEIRRPYQEGVWPGTIRINAFGRMR